MAAGGSAVKDKEQATSEPRRETVIPASDVQDRLGDVIDRAIAGEDFQITRYGSPRVYLVGLKRYEQLLELERAAKPAA